MKRLFVICVCMVLARIILAQKYGNEWINFSQKYYRVNILKTGLYRIDSLTLANAGISLASINPKNFQLFIKGEEQYIRISGENDNVFNRNDYIEFFAEKNDGRFDSLAYTNINRLPNPYIPLFNDTNYAFITWNSGTNNRRVSFETDVDFSGYTAAEYVYGEKVLSTRYDYSQGNVLFGKVSDPRYLETEGYGNMLLQNTSLSSSLSSAFYNYRIYPSPNLPVYIKASFSGASQHLFSGNDHQIKLEYYNNAGGYTVLNDTSFLGYKQLLVQKQITANLLGSSSASLKITSVSNPAFSGFTNKTIVHYLYLKCPQLTDFFGSSEQLFFVDNSSSNTKTLLDIQNVSVGSASVILYDLTNHKYITPFVSGNRVKALIPNASLQKKCFLTTSANVNAITSLAPVNQTGFFENYKTSNPDPAYLIISHRNLESAANNYKTYRQSVGGGSNHVILAYVNDLYDQFAYGNQKNPLAIKNFCRYLSDSLSTPPKYLLLLGKSIKHDLIRDNSINWNNCDVPTIGIPSSDNLLTAGIHGANSLTPFIPVGRVSAKTNDQAMDYLNKVKTHESTLPNHDDWRKHVLHFAGGTDAAQQQQFQSFLQSYSVTICDTLFGGKVYNFQKTTTAPIQITISDSVKQLIDYGASIITFFGHGSATGFDQAIDDPNAYNNKNKYPFFLANSCYSGDIHNPGSNSSASENFTLIQDKGSIGFLASSSIGLVGPLHGYSSAFYKSIAVDTYHNGIGDAVKNTCLKNSALGEPLLNVACLDMTLEGDPYIRLNAYAKPDYEIKNSSIVLDAQTYVDSIGVNVHIKNLGRAIVDTFIVRVERYFPTGDSATFLRKIKAPYNESILHFNILKDFEKGVGLNHFKVYVDAYSEIAELSETNNATIGTVDLFIPGGDVIPVYPYKYAIIPKIPQVTLKASTADPFVANANYRIQLDTNDRFINPINTTVVASKGGVVEWTVNLPLPDSTVYFWRITKDSVSVTDRFKWRESSFQVINAKFGWAQAHFHQFKNNNYEFVKFNRATRRFDFVNDIKSLECNNGFLPRIAFDQINYKVNNSLEDYWSCSPDGWSFAVFDSISVKPWQQSSSTSPVIGSFGNCICVSNQVLKSYAFGNSSYCGASAWQTNMENFLNAIPVNSKILAWTVQNHGSQGFSNTLHNAFEGFGASHIRTVKDTVPYIIFGTKGGAIGSALEILGANKNSVIQLRDTLKTRWNNGYIASEIIGPGAQWNSLHWKQTPKELPNTDEVVLKVVGIKSNGARDTLATFPKDSVDVYDLAYYVDAQTYPYLQLVARMRDPVSLTPPQLKKWQVMYDHAPECAVNAKKGFALTNDTIQEGETLKIYLPIENIGVVPFTDSLLVTYWLEDRDRVNHTFPQKMKLKPFIPSQVIIDTIDVATYQHTGQNYLWVDVNPPTHAKYQREQSHFNNIARIPFFVSTDKINPLLDVTFDGTHILNGDIVSAKPYVLISLKDENQFLALNDTSNFAIFIKYPNQNSEKRLYFANTLQFIPAHLPANSCKIEWKPELAVDGKYTLIVQATDRSKNVSGAIDYAIQFEVVTKQTVTEVLNYPNPFSTSTRFVFTLTGSEIPDVFTIQIMTITGKVVKEITKNELGNLRIGRNVTEYTWDGKDAYGDKLANGVYLYRVITRHHGDAVEKKQTDADTFFKKGIGKMVIMR